MTPETAPNLIALFFAQAAAKGAAPFVWRKADGAWRPTSWAEAARQVSALAQALARLGLQRGDRVIIVSENRPEWCIADLAIMAAGGVTVPAYTTNTRDDHAHILADSGARAAILSGPRTAKAFLPAAAGASACGTLIAIEPTEGCLDWQALIAAETPDPAATAAAAGFAREDLACIIYTSGTGGRPRGVCQHHGAILHNITGAIDILREFELDDDALLSFLPLSHALEHTAGQFLPIGVGAQIYYAESIEKLAANLAEVKPTVMIVVPRLFETLQARIRKAIEAQGHVARWLLAQALRIGPDPRPIDRPLDWLLERTLRRTVRARFGGRIKALVSGGAPLNPEIGRFFMALGVPLLQGYGQTEAAPVISCNRPSAGNDPATVGPPFIDTELRIAEDGEILVRGENVMHGYWNNPEETARVLVDGWLHTGDIGRLDAAGRLIITDRKKDIIVNDKGDNIAPQRIESLLTLQPEIMQAAVFGDRRPHLVGLIVPEAGVDGTAVAAAVDRVNKGLAATERVRRTLIADEPFTIDNGEMTPSLKIRRHMLRARYGARLDGLYKN